MLYPNTIIPALTQTPAEFPLEFTESTCLVAMSEQQIIGSIRAQVDGRTVHIGRLIVHPEHAGQGIGQQLLQTIEDKFKNHRLELFTEHRSEKNVYLYKKLGYLECRRKIISDELTLVYLEKFV